MNPPSQVKLCKDCRYYRPILFEQRDGICKLYGSIDLIQGKKQSFRASEARQNTFCGEEAKYHIPTPPGTFKLPYIAPDKSALQIYLDVMMILILVLLIIKVIQNW